jgi:3-deoxy-D-manno-octulosonic acid kinase
LDDYVEIECRGWRGIVRREDAEVIAAALAEGAGCSPAHEAGRGVLGRFQCGGGAGLVRKYRRGGLIRHVVSDMYFVVNRPRREFGLLRTLHARGLRVPEPLGACWRYRGPWCRGALATREIEAANLREHLAAGSAGESDLVAVGRLIREMHDIGVYHADLQLCNILMSNDGPYLIDFDNAFVAKQLTPMQRARNLLRLRRSIDKNGCDPKSFDDICLGYGDIAWPPWLDRLYKIKGRLSDTIAVGK